MKNALVITDLKKRYAGGPSGEGTEALKGVSFTVPAGELFALLGPNGAGKTTIIGIVTGLVTKTSGRVEVFGIDIEKEPERARTLIGLCGQEINFDPWMKPLDILVNQAGYYGIPRSAALPRAQKLLGDLGLAEKSGQIGWHLSGGMKRRLMIARALIHEPKFLILDEPTTVLTGHEIAILFALMERLKAKGVSLVYISHKLKEVKRICDRIMVLRDGEFICLEETASLDIAEMARRMVGRDLSQIFPAKAPGRAETAFKVEGLSSPGAIENVNFEIRAGEIVGFSGLIGAGRTETAETIMGIRKASSGKVTLDGVELSVNKPADAVRAGLSYLSEDRQGSGILTSFPVNANVTLVSLAEYARPLIDFKKELERTRYYVDQFEVKAPSLDSRLENLSGGNQQKISLAKSIDTKPRVLIVDEPTRGVDVKAKSDIYAFIRKLADEGLAVMFISSELEEIIGMCTRVVVMKEGRVVGQVEGDRINEEDIMYLATGITGGL